MNIGIIGAGPSGLCVIKELLDEGHTVTCFEKNNTEGGVFFYRTTPGGVYDSLSLTTSNYFTAFSSYPPKNQEARYHWTRMQYSDYLKNYSNKFNLFPHIQFNTEVVKVSKCNEEYKIITRCCQKEQEHVFDAIAICTGTHQIANIPYFQGQEKFQGQILHAESYKNNESFRDKRIVCIGIGESGADIVHEISNVAKSCMLSIRHYPWIINRYFDGDVNDALTAKIFYMIPPKYLEKIFEKEGAKILEKDGNPDNTFEDKVAILYQKWKRKEHTQRQQFATKNEIFLGDIVANRLQVNIGKIDYLTEKEVVFQDGSKFEADVIMCCTGYKESFPFLKDFIVIEDVRRMYKHMIHPELGSDIAFIGWARPEVGGAPACSEMQSRFFALLCSKKCKLPEKKELLQMIEKDRIEEEEYFYITPHLRTLVSYSKYMDSMAELIGCKPSRFSWNLLFTLKMLFGSQVSYQYRLRGPHSQKKMAKNIINKLPVVFTFKEMVKLSVACVYAKLFCKKNSS